VFEYANPVFVRESRAPEERPEPLSVTTGMIIYAPSASVSAESPQLPSVVYAMPTTNPEAPASAGEGYEQPVVLSSYGYERPSELTGATYAIPFENPGTEATAGDYAVPARYYAPLTGQAQYSSTFASTPGTEMHYYHAADAGLCDQGSEVQYALASGATYARPVKKPRSGDRPDEQPVYDLGTSDFSAGEPSIYALGSADDAGYLDVEDADESHM
jgi:hypothetical protein